jgi:peptide/nickel transport system substrate-binding protein
MSSPSVAVLSAVIVTVAAFAAAATRPRYGGALRVEIREAIETPDPPQAGPGLGDLFPAFAINRWEAGSRAVFVAGENAPHGRPFLDSVEVHMGRPLRDQSLALELGRADVVELGPAELRRQAAGRRVWSSSPVRVIALSFASKVEDARVREALSLAVDRSAIHNVLLQRQGEISAALLPQWLSGYAFVFPTSQDLVRARSLLAGMPAAARTLALSVEDPALRPVADRIALNARDAGLNISVSPQNAAADVRLTEARVTSSDPLRDLAALSLAFGLPAPPPRADTPEALYSAERSLLDGFHVIPLFHLPVVYGVSPRVKGGPGITPLGEWRFENLWLEGGRP